MKWRLLLAAFDGFDLEENVGSLVHRVGRIGYSPRIVRDGASRGRWNAPVMLMAQRKRPHPTGEKSISAGRGCVCPSAEPLLLLATPRSVVSVPAGGYCHLRTTQRSRLGHRDGRTDVPSPTVVRPWTFRSICCTTCFGVWVTVRACTCTGWRAMGWTMPKSPQYGGRTDTRPIAARSWTGRLACCQPRTGVGHWSQQTTPSIACSCRNRPGSAPVLPDYPGRMDAPWRNTFRQQRPRRREPPQVLRDVGVQLVPRSVRRQTARTKRCCRP